MQVTHTNFPAVADELIEQLRTCDFYAVDQEMTGINAFDVGKESPLQTLAEGYAARRAAAVRFTAFQLGICTFHKSTATNGTSVYTARPFNVWLRRRVPETNVTLNMSAVDFLLRNHMDFQFWLEEGVAYSNDDQKCEDAKYFSAEDPNASLSDNEAEWVQRTLAEVKSWYVTPPTIPTAAEDDNAKALPFVPPPYVTATPHISAAADLGLYHKLRTAGVYVTANPALDTRFPPFKRTSTSYTRSTKEAVEEAQRQQDAKRASELARRGGFRRVWDAMVALKDKPMLGHNYSSDLMFLLAMHGPTLPTDFLQFKAAVHGLFPIVIDTKTLAANLPELPFVNTSLQPLFEVLEAGGRNGFDVKLPLGFESYAPDVVWRANRPGVSKSSAVAHQGAYDAFMTGVVYCHFLHKYDNAAVRRCDNEISVFGSPFRMVLGQTADRLPPLAKVVVLHLPITANRNMAEDLLLTQHERDAKADRRGKSSASSGPPVSFWRPPEDPMMLVVCLRQAHADRLDALHAKAEDAESQLFGLRIVEFGDELPSQQRKRNRSEQ
jgi:poly(A)-specific ribonuclease